MPKVIGYRFYRLLGLVSVFIVSLALVSCGAKSAEDPTGVSLSGKVTYKGKPVVGGIVLESEMGGKKSGASFAEEGTYVIANAPPGKVKVTINLSPRHMAKVSGNNELPLAKETSRTLPSIDLHQGQNEFSVNLP